MSWLTAAASSKSSETGGLAYRSRLRTNTVHWSTSQMAAIVSERWSAVCMKRRIRSRATLRTTSIPLVNLPRREDFRQLAVSVEATPMFLGSLGELEYHGKSGLVGEASFGAHPFGGAPLRTCFR